MTDRPIIFSAPMVRALLDGRKTMTRRLAWTGGPKAARDGTITIRGSFAPQPSPWQRVQPGDRLWVREAHSVEAAGYEDGTGRLILYRATEPDAPTIWTPFHPHAALGLAPHARRRRGARRAAEGHQPR